MSWSQADGYDSEEEQQQQQQQKQKQQQRLQRKQQQQQQQQQKQQKQQQQKSMLRQQLQELTNLGGVVVSQVPDDACVTDLRKAISSAKRSKKNADKEAEKHDVGGGALHTSNMF